LKRILYAGLLSFLHPGLGQIYNRQYKKGFLYAVFPFISMFFLVFFKILWIIFILPFLGLLIFVLLYWLYHIINASIEARSQSQSSQNQVSPSRWKRLVYKISIGIMLMTDVPFYSVMFTKFGRLL
jgi:hypothetical protein